MSTTSTRYELPPYTLRAHSTSAGQDEARTRIDGSLSCRLAGLILDQAPLLSQNGGAGRLSRYSESAEFRSRFRVVSMCMVQTRKSIAPSIANASGHTTRAWWTKEVMRPATEQNRSAPIAFRKPASCRKARRPMPEAASRAATARNPRIRGAIMLVSTDQAGSRHANP